jgi:hypothetical protein
VPGLVVEIDIGLDAPVFLHGLDQGAPLRAEMNSFAIHVSEKIVLAVRAEHLRGIKPGNAGRGAIPEANCSLTVDIIKSVRQAVQQML